ncbi:MAG: 5-formyltetrahydrofolate cyclo-ligase [Flavobacteriales bacterium]|nr:5-formyltetrahydrofolate cyclo-ligase [Flavobacteriales bacterium]
MSIVERKKELRKEMLIKRAKFTKSIKAEYDTWICDSLLRRVEEQGFRTVHCYIPMGAEINISPLIEALLKRDLTVVSPKTYPKRKLKNLVLESLDKVEKGVFGTEHPIGDQEYEGSYDLVVVPGLAFDSNNYRLGYGGGYYDNFLVNYPQVKKIGIFYPFQEVEMVPTEPHDIQLSEILVNRAF